MIEPLHGKRKENAQFSSGENPLYPADEAESYCRRGHRPRLQ
jgi:hypothetical protein